MEPLVHWSHEETQALIGVWSEEKIQHDLEESFRNETVYREMSGRLAALGISRSAKQCRAKIKKLKQEYRNTRRHGERSEAVTKTFRWYDAMDTIMGDKSARTQSRERLSSVVLEVMVPDVEASPPAVTDTPESCTTSTHSLQLTLPRPKACPAGTPQVSSFYSVQLHEFDGPSTSNPVTSTAVQTSIKDTPLCCWSSKEVQALLTLWANPEVQQELLLNVRNNKVYTCLSSKLALLGFNKAPKKCREKIKKLKQEYKRIKNGQYRGGSSSVWFAIMDEVLSSQALTAKRSQTVQNSSTVHSLAVQAVVLDVDTDDETPWLPDEVQVLVTLWAQPNIQKQLLTAASDQVFTYLSSELSLVGFNKTPRQCSIKVNELKEEYKKIKHMEPYGVVKGDWFAILDSVFDADGATLKEVNSCAVQKKPKSPQHEHVDDKLRAVWTPDEVRVLLSRWAEERVQEQLRSNPRNERAFAQLSSELATQGFDKTTSQCRSKIALLTQKYRRIKAQEDPEKQKSRWFAIMDKVLSRSKTETETKPVRDSQRASLQTSQQSLPDTAEGCRLSVSSLCLLVPTLRLMCAFAWQVVQCCNVAQYRKVEELVKLVTEVAPELLTTRERVQLLLRLRARLVLELCLSENTTDLLNIQPHLNVIRDLTLSCEQEDATELENSKSNFVEVVHAILEDPEERQRFYKEVFSIYYGKQYDVTLQTLVWKFISRLDNLLPIPDIRQTAQWLSSAPSVTEECARLILEPDQLKALLNFHQQQSGNGSKCCSQADENMFLPKLLFNPKGNFQHVSAQLDELSSSKDERQSDYSEAKEPADCKAPVKDCGKEIKGLKLKHEQSDGMASSYCSDLNCAPLQLQTCSLCPYSDSHVSGLLSHIREEHLIQESNPITDPGKDCVFQRVRDQTFTPKMRRITDTCEYCGKVFKDVSALTSHIKTHTLPFHCDKCDKKYSSKWSLTVHRRIHTGETPYLCSYCGQGFRSSNILALHVRIHTGDRRYKCPICGKTSIQHLSRHMRMHRGEKNYLCTECGKAFLSSGELRLHMRFHTGERPYTCKHCGKGFIAKCLLTVHTRQHTGESPYRCSLCPKSFRTLRAQKRHLVIHSSKKSFQCLKCGKIFRQEETFKTHAETHK
ncbi:uncharacterized protein LOC120736115 isoform X2 [Simochromis diagramma]|uniref:uncharacterized protein LOC120736115 isoform X2 n=1 Tax=Simochromis diagramma TaxID=43689 RepID=UPI001A7E4D96|nr:uncharacterized protein LOC120736115 isoform X2 [Simochromis diagramma]